MVSYCPKVFIINIFQYAIIAVPLTKSENSADRAKAKKQALRAHLLFDDAMEIMEKRELSDKFNLNKS
jgi:hypothetical protein